MRRKFDSDVLSLMHFDYPYTGEPGDGMRDEIGVLSWEKVGNATFVGTEQPVAAVVADTPKFGWRCLQTATNTDYIKASEETGKLNLDKAGTWEMEAFVRRTGSTTGNVIALCKDGVEVFTVSLNTSGLINVLGDGISVNSATGPASSSWAHLCVRISGGICTVYLGGVDVGNASITPSIIEVDEIRLGGFPGQMDEFRLRRKAGSGLPIVPENPHRGSIPLKSLGGFGNGSQGDVTISEADVDINTTAIVQSGSPQMLTIGSQSEGRYGAIVPGDKVMIHVSLGRSAASVSELGKFSVRNVANVVGDILTLDSPIDEFVLEPQNYYVQVIKIPQFGTLTIPVGGSIVPKAWSTTTGGGMVALVTKGDCTVSGNITTVGKGATRIDNLPFCHAQMQERFLLTGNVFLLCGGTLTATGRIGATWDGSGKGGGGGTRGANGRDGSVPVNGYKGNVGFGGAGGYASAAFTPQAAPGSRSSFDLGVQHYAPCGSAGASLLIVAYRLALAASSLSSGGQGGSPQSGYTTGSGSSGGHGGSGFGGGGAGGSGASVSGIFPGGLGGGTGFCYLAYKEVI